MAAAASVLTLGPAQGATTRLSPDPHYLDAGVGLSAIFGNSHWVVSGEHAQQFGGTPAPTNYGYQIPGNETPRYMWAATCPKGQQELTFHRRIWLPGQPQSLKFYASPTSIGWSDPFSLVKLVVNDKAVVTSHQSEVSKDLYGGALPAAFHPGKNDIELRVTKKHNPDSIKSCDDSHPKTRLGIQTALIGQGFPADLAVRQPTASQSPQWFHLQPGASKAFIWTFSVTNKGPDASGAGKLGLLIQPGFLQLSDIVTSQELAPMHDCGVSGRNVTCEYDDWLQPGERTTITAAWKATAPADEPNTDVETMTVGWGIGTGNQQTDPAPENNTATVTVYICYPAATAYGRDKH